MTEKQNHFENLNHTHMSNLRNSVQLIGRLGKDPEVRTFDSGKKMTTFSIATTDTYKNQKGEKVQDTQWHNLVIWGKLADIAGQYLKKGKEIDSLPGPRKLPTHRYHKLSDTGPDILGSCVDCHFCFCLRRRWNYQQSRILSWSCDDR